MRRAPIVITTTIAGVAGVLAFQPREPKLQVASAAPSPDAAAVATASGSSGSAGGAPTAGSESSGASSGSSSASSGAPTKAAATKVVTGDAIPTRYGNAQVRVTIKNGTITEVEALQLQGNDPKSVQISGSAAPLLRESALTKQTAAIDAVSGATITSASYEASLQSALDKAGFKAADGTRGSSTIPDVEEHDGPPGGFGGFGGQ